MEESILARARRIRSKRLLQKWQHMYWAKVRDAREHGEDENG